MESSGEIATIPTLSDLHLSAIDFAQMMELLYSWEDISDRKNGHVLLRGGADNFELLNDDADGTISGTAFAQSPVDEAVNHEDVTDSIQPLKLIAYGTIPSPGQVSSDFDHQCYYSSLKKYRQMETDAKSWGDLLMFGEVVTSTNTLLEKYDKT